MLGGRSMAEYTKVALDAMGGDYAPAEIIKGAVDAVNKRKDIRVVVVGKEDIIKAELAKYTYDKEQIEIRNASEVIETGAAGDGDPGKEGFIACRRDEYG